MSYEGGYLVIPTQFIRTAHGEPAHTASLIRSGERVVSREMLDAVNSIQRVPWRVNSFVLDVMREAFVNGDTIGALPASEDIPLPPRLPDSVWEGMSKDERIAHKGKLAEIHSENASSIVKRDGALRKLQVAQEMRDEDAIWFPHSLDFRGRIYPLPQDINPQGDDLAKALLMFADGRPITERGLWWLAIAVANAFGQDKLTFEERFDWTMANLKLLTDSAINPLGGQRFWTTADEPWMALALTYEFAYAWKSGPEFISHIPVSVDGSCNGLQHLAAWGLDPIGAKATNLTRSEVKQDLYSEVAKVVTRIVERDAADNEEARHWLGRVDRKTVKRAVMTTPYGVTQRGIQNQLIQDRMVSGLGGSPVKNAGYLKDAIVEALESTVKSAKEIMGYIQGAAKALAEVDKAMRWTTPAGLIVEQSYQKSNTRRIETLIGELRIWKVDKNLGLNTRKQVLASAPNVIHSFDAAHLARTVNRCVIDHNITSFAFVHDSYGAHASNVDTMRDVLRDEFADIYQDDPIAKFEAGLLEVAPSAKLPKRPDRGDFDINEVRSSTYFFS